MSPRAARSASTTSRAAAEGASRNVPSDNPRRTDSPVGRHVEDVLLDPEPPVKPVCRQGHVGPVAEEPQRRQQQRGDGTPPQGDPLARPRGLDQGGQHRHRDRRDKSQRGASHGPGQEDQGPRSQPPPVEERDQRPYGQGAEQRFGVHPGQDDRAGRHRPERHHEQADARVSGQLEAQHNQTPGRGHPGQDGYGKARQRDADSGEPGEGVDGCRVAREKGEHGGVGRLTRWILIAVSGNGPVVAAVTPGYPLC